MNRCLRFLRTVMALCAIVAYGFPAATHGAPTSHPTHTAQQSAAAPCHGHDGTADLDHDAKASVDVHAPVAPAKCPAHKEGSVSCCVAMCHAALPLIDCPTAWVSQAWASSDGHIVATVRPAFVTRLDRPPKPRIASIG